MKYSALSFKFKKNHSHYKNKTMTKAFLTQLGVALKSNSALSEFKAMISGMNGDIINSRPATGSLAATAAIWTKSFDVTLTDTEGNVHTWVNQTQSSKVTIADTSVAGVASLASAHLVFVDGKAKVTISGTAAAWLAAETVTVTIASMTINGVTVTGGTHIITVA